jgi:dihydroorotase
MVDTGLLSWADVADRMSLRPARIGRVPNQGQPLQPGSAANVVLLDPGANRRVEPADTASLSRNTPFAGMELPGAVVATFLQGRPTVLDGKLQ